MQNSIQDSVHKLLSDQIHALGLSEFYEIQRSLIRGRNGTEFAFEGLKHNINSIKSFEGVDICWVEEAQTVSKTSWDVLIPTIRKDGSEIWITFNPELDTDETYKRFIASPPATAHVVKVNWFDNPWFPDVLRKEKDSLKDRDPDAYLNVWEGHCRQTLDGAVYAREIREAMEAGRITRVPHSPQLPVFTFWDLGWADMTSIWFAQSVPGAGEFRIIDFYQNRQQKLAHYAAVLQQRGYLYEMNYLPHDADHQTLAGRSVSEQLRDLNFSVSVLPRGDVADGINAARTIFPRCYFDEQKCSDGIQALRHYRYDVDPDTGQFSKKPLHDMNSHAADAFRYLAVAIQEQNTQKRTANSEPISWMG